MLEIIIHGTNIKNVIIEEGIEIIDEYAFECMSMVNVKLPSTIKSIKDGGFGWCEELETINFPEGLEKIGYESFTDCIKLNNITFPSTLTKIEKDAFYDCYSLEYVYIPKTLISVDGSTFQSGCWYIDVDPEHENYKSIDGVLFSKDMKTLLTYCAGNTRTEYTVPNGTEIINEGAFIESKYITTIHVANSVKTIEAQTFRTCKKLTYIDLSNVNKLEEDAFFNCTSLENIYIPSSVRIMEKWIFSDCKSTLKIYCGASNIQENWDPLWNCYKPGYPSRVLTVNYGYTLEEYNAAVANS